MNLPSRCGCLGLCPGRAAVSRPHRMGAVWGGDIRGTISFRRVLNGKHLVGCVLKGERFPLVVPLLLLEHM